MWQDCKDFDLFARKFLQIFPCYFALQSLVSRALGIFKSFGYRPLTELKLFVVVLSKLLFFMMFFTFGEGKVRDRELRPPTDDLSK